MKRIFSLVLCISVVSNMLPAQPTVEALLEKANELRDQFKEAKALDVYNQIIETDATNLEALCGAAFLSARLGFRATEPEKSTLYNASNDLADKALAVDAGDAEANYVKALAVGRIAEISPTKEKIEASKDVKKYSEQAIKLDKSHAGAWHLLGKWHYGVKDLGITKMLLINLIYGGMPKASYESAIECYNKAINLRPDYILYYLDLAIAYERARKDSLAIAILKKAIELPPVTPDDPGYLKDCKTMLEDLQ